MAQGATLRTTGIFGPNGMIRASDRAGKEARRVVRSTLREVGDVVRVEAARRFEQVDARTAAGYRVVVRQRGVSVEQSLRKTTGRHPEFGALQMRDALEPALEAKADTVERRMEDAIGKVADHFER